MSVISPGDLVNTSYECLGNKGIIVSRDNTWAGLGFSTSIPTGTIGFVAARLQANRSYMGMTINHVDPILLITPDVIVWVGSGALRRVEP